MRYRVYKQVTWNGTQLGAGGSPEPLQETAEKGGNRTRCEAAPFIACGWPF